MTPEEARRRDRQWGWTLLVCAPLFFMTGACGYYRWDSLEQNGGVLHTTRREASIYDTFGKAGFPILFGGGGLICLGAAAWKLTTRHDDSQHSKDDPETPGMAPSASAQCPKCGGVIRTGASFCRHCKEWLS